MRLLNSTNAKTGDMGYVGIVGGGIAGVTTALSLANKGYHVSLFEGSPKLLEQSSDATPCRLGIGFHYMDVETALLNLETSIEIIRYLKESIGYSFQVFDSDINNDYVRIKRVTYAISEDTLVPRVEILRIFNVLKSRYSELISLDKNNEVLGSVESFYREIDKEKYIGVLNTEKLIMVLETCETLFDWPLFKTYLLGKVYSHKNIKIHTNSRVMEIKRDSDFNFRLSTSQVKSYQFKFVINCSWYDVDRLNGTAGYENNLSTINRVKCMAVIKVPERMNNAAFMVGYGPFCSLSSLANGVGYLTYEPVTNIAQFSSNAGAGEEIEYMKDAMQAEKQVELGRAIIEGALTYIPGLHDCDLIGLKTGIVRTDHGIVDIHSKGSHFKRTFKGVYAISLGFMVNEARKHTYWCNNMQHILRLVECQEYLLYTLPILLSFLRFSISEPINTKVILRALKEGICETLLNEDNIENVKRSLSWEFKRRPTLFRVKELLHKELLIKVNHPVFTMSKL